MTHNTERTTILDELENTITDMFYVGDFNVYMYVMLFRLKFVDVYMYVIIFLLYIDEQSYV